MQAQRRLSTFEVVVPDGVGPGDDMTVDIEGEELTVSVPRTSFSGDLITIEHEMPSLQASCRELEVVVPEGIEEGEPFAVETAEGVCFDVECPFGCRAGCCIVVTLPVSPEVAETPCQEEAMEEQTAADAPEELHPWHRYGPGARVNVLRTDGSYSSGTVLLSFEGVFGALYHVRLSSGQEKAAVPECDMFSAEDSEDPGFREHYEAALAAAMEAEMLDSMCESVLND